MKKFLDTSTCLCGTDDYVEVPLLRINIAYYHKEESKHSAPIAAAMNVTDKPICQWNRNMFGVIYE